MTEAERVLAEVAERVHQRFIDHIKLRKLTAPYLNKPKPADVLAEAFVDIGWSTESSNGYRPDRLRAMLAKRGYAVIKIAPKPEPDRLTVAARECMAVDCTGASAKLIMDGKFDESDEFRDTRAIIAAEVAVATADITSQRDAAAAAACYHIEKAAAEPSDEAVDRAYEVIWRGAFPTTTSARAAIRAALKGEGA